MSPEERARALRAALTRGKPSPMLMAVTLYPDRNAEIEAALASAIRAAEDEILERAVQRILETAPVQRRTVVGDLALDGCRIGIEHAVEVVRSLKSSKGGGR